MKEKINLISPICQKQRFVISTSTSISNSKINDIDWIESWKLRLKLHFISYFYWLLIIRFV